MVEFIFIEIADLKPKGKKLKVSYKGTVAICKVSCKVAKEISGQFFFVFAGPAIVVSVVVDFNVVCEATLCSNPITTNLQNSEEQMGQRI